MYRFVPNYQLPSLLNMNLKSPRLCCLLLVGISSALASNTFAQTAAPAAEAAQTEAAQPDASQLGSLMRIPDSAGIYLSTMNHKAIVDTIFESNAYKAIKASDVSRGMKKAYRRGRSRGYQPYNENNPFAQYLKGYGESIDSVVFQSIWQIAGQVVDNELFIYIDNDMISVAKSVQEIQSKMIELGLGVEPQLEDLSEDQLQKIFVDALADLECPTAIIGSRLDDAEGFRGMLDLARSFAEQGIDSLPQELDFVRKMWKVVDEENHFLMMAELDMSAVPWNDLMAEMGEEEKKQIMLVREAIKGKTAVLALGVLDNLLVMGIAKDQERLISFGGENKLIDIEATKPLRKAIDENQKLVSVFYMSQQYAEASYSLEQPWEQIRPIIRPLLSESGEFDADQSEELATKIETEVQELIADFSENFPTYGGFLSMTSLREDGLYGYTRMAGKHPMVDGSKPLKLAAHAGPNTIMFFNQRFHRLADQYGLAAKWGSKLYQYGRDFAFDQMADELPATAEDADGQPNVESIKAYLADFEGIAKRFDSVTREKLLPSIDGQEAGLFLDGVSGPMQWHPEMPKSDKPLPIPMPAFITQTSDSKAVIEAGEQYWKLTEEMLSSIKKHFPDEEVQDLALVPPNRTEQNGVTSFRWSVLHDMAEVDESIQPGVMISKDFIVANMHAGQAKELTTAKDGSRLFGPAKTNQPSIGIGFYDHEVAMDMLEMWAEFGLKEARNKTEVDPLDMVKMFPAERDTLQFTEAQLRDAFDRVWAMGKCFKGVSIRTYDDETGMVSEGLMKFEDIASE